MSYFLMISLTWIYLMHNCSKLAQIYRTFAKMIFIQQFSKVIKVFRIDNAMEYRDAQFLDFIHTQAPLFSVPVQEHLSKMVGLNANTVTYLTMLGLSSFLPHILNVFRGKPPSPLSTPSTIFHPQLSKICLPLNVSMVLHLHILLFASLVMHALFYFIRTNISN